MNNNPLLDNDEVEQKQSEIVFDNRAETGIANEKKQKSIGKKSGIFIILFGILLLLFLLVPKLYHAFKGEEVEEEKPIEVRKTTEIYRKPEEPTKPKVFSLDEPKPTELLGGAPVVMEKPKAKLIKSMGDMMIQTGGSVGTMTASGAESVKKYNDSTQKAIEKANAQLGNVNGSPKNVLGETGKSDPFSESPTFTAQVARKSEFNPNLLLEQGTLIPCALRVKVISNITGQLSCVISENVYSSNGNVLLIEKGSRVNGYYQGNNVSHGSSQLFVIWQEVRTMNNLVIPLASGSTDELGANGLNGWVDNHFWERFSNAIMLSMILDGNNILLSKMTDTAQNNSENTREASKEIATTVLEQMGDIKPTLYKNQGDKVGIFVARDIDFSNVYELKRAY